MDLVPLLGLRRGSEPIANIRRARDSDARFMITWDGPEIDPRAVAFLLASKVYEWFGIEHEQIPYTGQVENRLVVSPDRIRGLGT